MNSNSYKDIEVSINNVSIFIGDVFDFVRVYYIKGLGPLDAKLFLIYKRQSDNLQIYFTLRQAVYFTVKGNHITIPNNDDFDFPKEHEKINGNYEDYYNKIAENKMNFVDSFIVLKGNEDSEHHRPNLDINQPILGIGIDWMKSSIEKKELEIILKQRREADRQKNIELEKKKEIEKLKLIKLLNEEKERASNESSLETLNRQFEYLKKTHFESFTNK